MPSGNRPRRPDGMKSTSASLAGAFMIQCASADAARLPSPLRGGWTRRSRGRVGLSNTGLSGLSDPAHHPLRYVDGVPVAEPEYSKSSLPQERVANSVVLFLPVSFVIVAVKLDDDARAKPRKIDNIRTHRRLAAEPHPLRFELAQVRPQDPLCLREVFAVIPSFLPRLTRDAGMRHGSIVPSRDRRAASRRIACPSATKHVSAPALENPTRPRLRRGHPPRRGEGAVSRRASLFSQRQLPSLARRASLPPRRRPPSEARASALACAASPPTSPGAARAGAAAAAAGV